MHQVNLALVGLGTVGSGLVKLLDKHALDYQRDLGIQLNLHKVCSRTASKAAMLGISRDIFTSRWQDLIDDDELDIIIELIGGTDQAYELVKAALQAGKSVVTANKALLALHGAELFALAQQHGVSLKFEASVGGGIPIIGPLCHSLHGNQICTIAGIMNGTTNYILTRMAKDKLPFSEVLADAQALGYAEADPSADVDGYDAANKIAILAQLGFHTPVDIHKISVEGIRSISPTDIAYAESMDYAVKLLAIARRTPQGMDIRVHPTMISIDHPLARVDGVYNAIYVIGDAVQETMFLGPGAGSYPTASAVMGDILELARTQDYVSERSCEPADELVMRDILDIHTQYYVRLLVDDEPGTLASTAQIFGTHNISIMSMVQRKSSKGLAELVYVTHRASEREMSEALRNIAQLSSVRKVATLIRVEDTETWKKGILR